MSPLKECLAVVSAVMVFLILMGHRVYLWITLFFMSLFGFYRWSVYKHHKAMRCNRIRRKTYSRQYQ